MAIDTDALLAAIDAHRDNAYGSDDHSALGEKRAKAIEAYLGLNVNPAPEGRSQVVDRTVYQTIHTILPSLVRIFASSSEDVCKFVPVGPEDEPAAEQQTAVINHMVTGLNPWEQIASDWIHDALLLSNGYCLAYWDESERVVQDKYEGQSEDQLMMLLQDKGVRVVEHSEYVDEQLTADAELAHQQQLVQWQQMAQQAQAQGQPAPPQPPAPGPQMLHDVTIERVENEGKVCIKVLPPEHCYVSGETPDWTLNECPYFEYREQKTIADLRAMGLEVPDDVSDDEEDHNEEDFARDRFGEDQDPENMKGPLRRVWARMIWCKADAEGQNDSRLYYSVVVGRTVLYVEPCSRIPVASICAQPLPHRHIGMSLAETVMDVQDIRTAVTRGGLDNLYLTNNGRHVVSSRVNLEDFLDARPGGVVRMLDDSMPAEGHIVPLTHPFAFEQIIGSLEYFDQIAQNRTGASRYFSGTDANAINKTASGTMALQNMAAMRVEHVARMMAPGVEALFAAVQEIVSKHRNKPLAIKLRGQWVTVDPQAWRTKRDVRISVGVGAGNKESMLAQLTQMFQTQMMLAPMGLAGPQQLHATVTEMGKLAGFANPAKFWQDPSQMAPQPPQIPPEVQREQVRAQADQQRLQFEAQQAQMKAQAEQMLERERMTLQAQTDQAREEMQARQKQLELQQKAEFEQIKASYQAQADERREALEKWKAELDAAVKLQIAQMSKPPEADPNIERLLQEFAALREELNSPTEIVRDESGRAVGVKRGNRVRSINRGPDGRAVGVQ
jgi:hypothetical protein